MFNGVCVLAQKFCGKRKRQDKLVNPMPSNKMRELLDFGEGNKLVDTLFEMFTFQVP
jgi:hypothetical protein